MDLDTLARSRGAQGDDHPDSFAFADSRAIDYCDIGDFRMARDLDQDTLACRRRVLGDDHPDTHLLQPSTSLMTCVNWET